MKLDVILHLSPRLERFMAEINDTVAELTVVVAQVADAVNTLEAAVTEALKNQGVPAEVKAALEAAVASLKATVADAADGVDEAVAPAPVV